MNEALPDAAFTAEGLLAKLMAAVRPEFRVDIFVPERGTLLFSTAPCQVPGCVRQPRTRGLCKGHYYAWQQQGRPDIDTFVTTATPEGLGRKELTVCLVAGMPLRRRPPRSVRAPPRVLGTGR